MMQKIKAEGGRRKAERKICSQSSLCAITFPLPPSPLPLRSGITLIEVLISMFVLLFGLMGVAAIFPVASHYVLEGDKRDRSSGLAQIAFEELKARNVLQPRYWLYAMIPPGDKGGAGAWFTQQPAIGARGPNPNVGTFNLTGDEGPGHAFVIDSLGAAAGTLSSVGNLDVIPLPGTVFNPWFNPPSPSLAITGERFPVRRMTLSFNATWLQGATAETIFRLRDDLAVEQPDAGDRPSVQRWSVNDNGTPTVYTDDQLLARQYTGDYSWLATVVPTSQRALLGMQPAANIKDAFYEVTTVVFYKRDVVPSTSTAGTSGSERLIGAEFLNGSELAIYDDIANNPDAVDLALDGIKPTNWIAVMGVNQITGVFMMKWYKIQALDDENTTGQTLPGAGTNQTVRYLMVQGPDWPASSYTNLRVAILPGAIDAYTRVMQVDVE